MSDDHKSRPDGDEEEVAYADDAVIGRAFRGSAIALLAIALIGLAVMYFRSRSVPQEAVVEKTVEAPKILVQETAKAPRVGFVDVTAASGITFAHVNGARGKKFLPETMGSGVAFLDYDVDGRILTRDRGSWTTTRAVSQLPDPRPGVGPARSP